VGDRLRLGAPRGERLTLSGAIGAPGGAGLLLIAGGTGLAPLKALLEQMAAEAGAAASAAGGTTPAPVNLFFGVRAERELYDLDALRALAREHPWLTVTTAVADPDDPQDAHEQGNVVDVALRHGTWNEHDIYVCGSDEMVVTSVRQLHRAGCAVERIRWEGFRGLAGEAYGVIDLEEDSPR
jgi:NAD(P)H-flavin reductase